MKVIHIFTQEKSLTEIKYSGMFLKHFFLFTPLKFLSSFHTTMRISHYKLYNIIWNRHGHECSRIWKLSGNFTLIQCNKKCRDFLGRDILRTTFFRAESSLIQSSCRSFIRVIVPYEISKVNFRVETQILVSMSEEI
jgi:hypothetical protein